MTADESAYLRESILLAEEAERRSNPPYLRVQEHERRRGQDLA
jgi:hypothetical protein